MGFISDQFDPTNTTPPPSLFYYGETVCFDIAPDNTTPSTVIILNKKGDDVTSLFNLRVSGSNSPNAWCIDIPCSLEDNRIIIRVAESANPYKYSEHHFSVDNLQEPTPIGSIAGYVGGPTTFTSNINTDVTWNITGEAISSKGRVSSWNSEGLKTVTYSVNGACSISSTFQVYPSLEIEGVNPGDAISFHSTDTYQLSVLGGSGNYSYTITGPNQVNKNGLISSTSKGGTYLLTIIDIDTNQRLFNVVKVESQYPFCVSEDLLTEKPVIPCYPEFTIDCEEFVDLKIPSFQLRNNHGTVPIFYFNNHGCDIGNNGYIKSNFPNSRAIGSIFDNLDSTLYVECITSLEMADPLNGLLAIGLSEDSNLFNNIDELFITGRWFTDGGARKFQLYNNSSPILGTLVDIQAGDVVSVGYKDGNYLSLMINNIEIYKVFQQKPCNELFVTAYIELVSKSLGGYLSGLTWNITTDELPIDIGSINSNGTYIPPIKRYDGLVSVEASLGNAVFRAKIRNIKATPRYSDPKSLLNSGIVDIWVGPYVHNFTETPRLAKDGTPDSLQNPDLMYLGFLKGATLFNEQREYQEFTNDLGVYYTSVSKEKIEIEIPVLGLNDINKISRLLNNPYLQENNLGVSEVSVGNSNFPINYFRVLMVIGEWESKENLDVLYFPKVQNKSNLTVEAGVTGETETLLKFNAVPDKTRPEGKQLYSIINIENDTKTDPESCMFPDYSFLKYTINNPIQKFNVVVEGDRVVINGIEVIVQ